MKKFIILLALILILGGCGNAGESTETSADETDAAVELAEETEDGEGQSAEFEVSKDVVTDADFDQFAAPSAGDTVATIKTSMGDIKVKFFQEDAPKAVENFTTHAKNGYFDGITFHRVINDFMIQSGSKDGTGTDGDSIWGENFEDEFAARLHNYRGALSMANSGPGTNSSQFFIVQAGPVEEEFVDFLNQISEFEEPMYMDNRTGQIVSGAQRFTQKAVDNYEEIGGTPFLDGGFPNEEGVLKGHTVFGQVFEGMEIVDKIAATVPEDGAEPTEVVTIEKVEIGTY